ncbi:MAG TPA: TetR/AcrR family transcriptional regulator [Streptosporangiaceae bacterium]
MGRPREHDERTAASLLDAAEQMIEGDGIAALSLREVARRADTTTRAVYSLFGSREALLGALGARSYELLTEGLRAIPVTADPRADLIQAALVFRRFTIEHPVLFSISFHRVDPAVWPRFQQAASDALAVLHQRFEPLAAADLLGGRAVAEAATEFHALCEGLAGVELRARPAGTDLERLWRNGFHALITGFADRPPDDT